MLLSKRYDIPFLVLLFSAALPISFLSLGLIVFFVFYSLFLKGVDTRYALVVIPLLLINLFFSIFINGIAFSFNFVLYCAFFMPFLFFCITRDAALKSIGAPISEGASKRSIELFIFIQCVVSLINAAYRYAVEGHASFDTDFGDIIAGTFRIPLVYIVDAANKTFVFAMMLVLFVYIVRFGKAINKSILVLALVTIFIGSVNHLVLAAICGVFLSIAWRRPVIVFVSSALLVGLYAIAQPTNFGLIVERLELLFAAITDSEKLAMIGQKGEYWSNFIHDFHGNLVQFLTFGVGLGTYSSRAAMYLSGLFVSIGIVNVSGYLKHNSYMLFYDLMDKPLYMRGAFFFPYDSVSSLIAEFGLIGTLALMTIFVKKIKAIHYIGFDSIIYICTFLILAGLVDHYFEYYQAIFIFVIALIRLNFKKNNDYPADLV